VSGHHNNFLAERDPRALFCTSVPAPKTLEKASRVLPYEVFCKNSRKTNPAFSGWYRCSLYMVK
jgi:hypothetical protein